MNYLSVAVLTAVVAGGCFAVAEKMQCLARERMVLVEVVSLKDKN